jgi:hypothetical protein
MKPIDIVFDLLSSPMADMTKADENIFKTFGRRISIAGRRVSSLVSRLRTNKHLIAGTKTRIIPHTALSAHRDAQASFAMIISDEKINWNFCPSHSEPCSNNSSSSSNIIVVKRDFDSVYKSLSVKNDFMNEFLNNIDKQRQQLTLLQKQFFDNKWGITEESLRSKILPDGAEEQIRNEIEHVMNKKKEKISKLKIATREHIGLELLHLFILDLLGRDTPAAYIFKTKSEEDFRHAQVVTKKFKIVLSIFVVVLNIFFSYYSILHGYQKGLHWQRSYLAGCISQLLIEIFLFETVECIWIQFIIPNLVFSEVQRACNLLSETVNELSLSHSNSANKLFLNVPDYLFLSTNVAKAFPELMESVIIQ